MSLRKITFDNSVRYEPSTNSSQSENSHDHKPKTVSNPRKQIKNLSQSNKMFIKDYIRAESFKMVKWIPKNYFYLKNIQIS